MVLDCTATYTQTLRLYSNCILTLTCCRSILLALESTAGVGLQSLAETVAEARLQIDCVVTLACRERLHRVRKSIGSVGCGVWQMLLTLHETGHACGADIGLQYNCVLTFGLQ